MDLITPIALLEYVAALVLMASFALRLAFLSGPLSCGLSEFKLLDR